MYHKFIFLITLCTMTLSSCSDLSEVVPPEDYYEYEVFTDISRAQEFLNSAYKGVRKSPDLALEYYTDNAISKGGLPEYISTENSPVAKYWKTAMKYQLYINEFFEKSLDVRYSAYDSIQSIERKNRAIGEAYGLRAYYKWLLLKNFSGPSSEDSTMLGFPIIDGITSIDNINTIPRATYMDSYVSIMADIDSSFFYLADLKNRYSGNGDMDGIQHTSRVCKEMLTAMKARVALYAASPAYQQISSAAACDTIYNAMQYLGGIRSLQPYDFYNETENSDHFWRVSYFVSGDLEKSHFPPSLMGQGNCNPTQNFAEAFGDTYGYPVAHEDNYLYDYENFPYIDRDLRFYYNLFYNGKNEFKEADIQTYIGGYDLAGIFTKTATRTSYYMKKFLSPDIELDPTKDSQPSDFKVYPIFTRTGLYLDFIEASAMAYGMAGKGSKMEYNSIDALEKIRMRFGTKLEADYYVDDLSMMAGDPMSEKEYLELVYNERRIEYAFEGERFYDIRRTKMALDKLNEPLRGIDITMAQDSTFSYDATPIVQYQFFEPYMYYNPIPYDEVMRSSAIVQNAGW